MTLVEQIRQYAICLFCKGDIVEIRAIRADGAVNKSWVQAEELAGQHDRLRQLNEHGWNGRAGRL